MRIFVSLMAVALLVECTTASTAPEPTSTASSSRGASANEALCASLVDCGCDRNSRNTVDEEEGVATLGPFASEACWKFEAPGTFGGRTPMFCGPLYQAWLAGGGLSRFGHPVLGEYGARSRALDDGRCEVYAERQRLVYQPQDASIETRLDGRSLLFRDVLALSRTAFDLQSGVVEQESCDNREADGRFLFGTFCPTKSWPASSRDLYDSKGGGAAFGFAVSPPTPISPNADAVYFERARLEGQVYWGHDSAIGLAWSVLASSRELSESVCVGYAQGITVRPDGTHVFCIARGIARGSGRTACENAAAVVGNGLTRAGALASCGVKNTSDPNSFWSSWDGVQTAVLSVR